MAHPATGVDDVWHVTRTLGGIGTHQGLARARQHLRWIILVEQNRADRVFAYRPDAVRQKQPPFIQLDGRSAIADLDELPRKRRLQKCPMPLFPAAAPRSGVIRKARKSVVSISSERIALPLYAV